MAYVNTIKTENVEGNVYLGQRCSNRDKYQDKEIHRRITAGWAGLAKHSDILYIYSRMSRWNGDWWPDRTTAKNDSGTDV